MSADGIDVNENAKELFDLVVWDHELELPMPLSSSITLNNLLVNDLSNVDSFYIFKGKSEFKSCDKRYLMLEKDEIITGMIVLAGWVYGVKEMDHQGVGFVPHSYLAQGIIGNHESSKIRGNSV